MTTQRYLIALGSNLRHARHGTPRAVLAAARLALVQAGLEIEIASPTLQSAPVGPSLRRYANAAVLVRTALEPQLLLGLLKTIEHRFGRRPGGMRWRARVLDLDVILWSGGEYASRNLIIPHPLFRDRDFVLIPAATIAPNWRDPRTGLSIRQLARRPRPHSLTGPLPRPRGHRVRRHAGPLAQSVEQLTFNQ
ncbi:2-amino-4-hydroxy-6-hydroxymethyldihydropteridine diphosphokinase [Novosphingobium sp. RD2P27]|uniref:2-amino-4-hydroxy-6-hydroxymethyldihydropteridine pyrophosphokinase n=1 Tax=Novosphingobium kalidii TaxID=3230299 RepID=A0ABV2D5M6_9SPHN